MSANESEEPRRPTNFQGVVDDEGNVTITVPAWLSRLGAVADRLVFIARAPVIWIVAVLLGVPVTAATIDAFYNFQGPLWDQVLVPLQQKGPVAVILDDFLYRSVLLPAGAELFAIGADIVGGVLGAFGFLADIPLFGARAAAAGILAAAGGVATGIHQFNLGLAEPVTALGVGAQPAATAIGAVQIFGGAWLLWILVRTIDVPFIDPVGLLLAVTRPFRNFWRLFFP